MPLTWAKSRKNWKSNYSIYLPITKKNLKSFLRSGATSNITRSTLKQKAWPPKLLTVRAIQREIDAIRDKRNSNEKGAVISAGVGGTAAVATLGGVALASNPIGWFVAIGFGIAGAGAGTAIGLSSAGLINEGDIRTLKSLCSDFADVDIQMKDVARHLASISKT